MRVTWIHLPRLLPSPPKNLGLASPEATVAPRRMHQAPAFTVQGPRRTVELTLREWELLSLLFDYRGSYLTRETIISRVWGPHYIRETRLFKDTLTSLRASMKQAGYPSNLIHERSGIGWGVREASKPE